MSDETTLLSCPFCGGEAIIERIGKSGYLYVACNTPYCCDFGKFDTEAEAIAAWNTRTHGTLTAEQVREAIEHHGTASLGCRWQFTDRNLQAIADELNAEVGGTCENLAKHDALWFACSKCGAQAGNGTYSEEWMHQDHTDEECAEYDGEPFNYCPNCGALVRKAVER